MACSGLRCIASSTQPGASATPAPSSSSRTSIRGWRCARTDPEASGRASIDAPWGGLLQQHRLVSHKLLCCVCVSCCCGRSCPAASAKTGQLPTRPPLRGSTCFQSMLQRTPATTSATSSSGSVGKTDHRQRLGRRTDWTLSCSALGFSTLTFLLAWTVLVFWTPWNEE